MAPPRLDNRTDFIAFPHVLVDRDGEKRVTMVKATFRCAGPPIENPAAPIHWVTA
jgi:hypothetical protein